MSGKLVQVVRQRSNRKLPFGQRFQRGPRGPLSRGASSFLTHCCRYVGHWLSPAIPQLDRLFIRLEDCLDHLDQLDPPSLSLKARGSCGWTVAGPTWTSRCSARRACRLWAQREVQEQGLGLTRGLARRHVMNDASYVRCAAGGLQHHPEHVHRFCRAL
jgi:hypothetical protein